MVKVFLVSILFRSGGNRPATMRPDDEMGSQTGHVTSPHDRSCTCLHRDERSSDQFEIPFHHQAVPCRSIFSLMKEKIGKTSTTPLTSPTLTYRLQCSKYRAPWAPMAPEKKNWRLEFVESVAKKMAAGRPNRVTGPGSRAA